MAKVEMWNYTGRNTNARAVQVGDLELFFSYRTCIAFRKSGKLYISHNRWGQTTGKHLNAISSDKSIRLSSDEFQTALNEALASHTF